MGGSGIIVPTGTLSNAPSRTVEFVYRGVGGVGGDFVVGGGEALDDGVEGKGLGKRNCSHGKGNCGGFEKDSFH
jgi:hypothetical protein